MFAYGILWLNALFVPGKVLDLGRTEGLPSLDLSQTPYPAGAAFLAQERSRGASPRVGNRGQLDLMQRLLEAQPQKRPTTAQLLADGHFLPPSAQDDSQLPKGWTPMAGAFDNYMQCELQSSDPEYLAVRSNFLRSAAGRPSIVRIERVQNRFLWAAFRHERKQLERKHGQAPVERQLWCETLAAH